MIDILTIIVISNHDDSFSLSGVSGILVDSHD